MRAGQECYHNLGVGLDDILQPHREAMAEGCYNLNILRYIDSGETENLPDLGAHLHGGIPNRDIGALARFWSVFPGLRERLFAPRVHEAYIRARVGTSEVREVVHEHDEFTAHGDWTRRVFDCWWQAHERSLHEFGEDDSPRALIRDLLQRFAGLPLLD